MTTVKNFAQKVLERIAKAHVKGKRSINLYLDKDNIEWLQQWAESVNLKPSTVVDELIDMLREDGPKFSEPVKEVPNE